MAKDFGVTSGHPLYSMHRFRQDVRHMVIFDDLIEHGFHRVRLYLTDEAYEVTRSEEKKGHIKIIYHIPVIEGSSSSYSTPLILLLLSIFICSQRK